MEAWGDFFAGTATAAGALVGLMFVALSVNVKEIIQGPSLLERAAATIGTLVLVLVGNLACLLRGQPPVQLGLEIALLGLPAGWLQLRADRKVREGLRKGDRSPRLATFQILVGYLQLAPYWAGGVLLAMGQSAGFSWLAAGSLCAFAFTMVSAWVLLIEILR